MRKRLAAFVAATMLSSCGTPKEARASQLVDPAAPDTWLTESEATSGRKLTIASVPDLYFVSQGKCIFPKDITNPHLEPKSYNSAVWPSAEDERAITQLVAFLDGTMTRPIVPPMRVGLRPALGAHTGYFSPRVWQPLDSTYARCRMERGDRDELLHEARMKALQVTIAFHATHGDFSQVLQAPDRKLAVYTLSDHNHPYCRISLAIRDARIIDEVFIDVLTAGKNIPTFDDAKAYDCMLRGIVSGFGYVGVLRFPMSRLYAPEDLRGEALASGQYLTRMTSGLARFGERLYYEKPGSLP